MKKYLWKAIVENMDEKEKTKWEENGEINAIDQYDGAEIVLNMLMLKRNLHVKNFIIKEER